MCELFTTNECEIAGAPAPASGYPAVAIGGTDVHDITITDCYIHDFSVGVKLSGPIGNIIITGNHFYRHTGDCVNLNRNAVTLVGTVTRISQNTFEDCINPGAGHADSIQITHGSSTEPYIGLEVEENIFLYTNIDISIQLIFLECTITEPFKDFQINRNVGMCNTTWAIGATYTDGGYITNNTFTHIGTQAGASALVGIRAPNLGTVTNNTKVYGNIVENVHVADTLTQAGNVELGSRGATIAYTTAMDGPWTSAGPTTRAELLAAASMKLNGPADQDTSGTPTVGDAGAIGSGAWTPPTSTPGTAGAARDLTYETHYDP